MHPGEESIICAPTASDAAESEMHYYRLGCSGHATAEDEINCDVGTET